MTTRWQHKPSSHSFTNSRRFGWYPVVSFQFTWAHHLLYFGSFLQSVFVYSGNIYSQPSVSHYYRRPVGSYLPLNKGVLDSFYQTVMCLYEVHALHRFPFTPCKISVIWVICNQSCINWEMCLSINILALLSFSKLHLEDQELLQVIY